MGPTEIVGAEATLMMKEQKLRLLPSLFMNPSGTWMDGGNMIIRVRHEYVVYAAVVYNRYMFNRLLPGVEEHVAKG